MERARLENWIVKIQDMITRNKSREMHFDETMDAVIDVFGTVLGHLSPSSMSGLDEKQKGMAMSDLAQSFPAMRSKMSLGTPGLMPWDCLKLDAATEGWSSSEKNIVNFLLAVWDAGTYGERFKFIDALQTWDASNLAAFNKWMRQPFFM